MLRQRAFLFATVLAASLAVPAMALAKTEGGGVSHYTHTKGTDGELTFKVVNPGPGAIVAVEIEWADDGTDVNRCTPFFIPPRAVGRDVDVGIDGVGLTEVLSASTEKGRPVAGHAGASHKHALVAEERKSYQLPEDDDARDDLVECVCQALTDIAAPDFALKQFKKYYKINCF